MGREVGRPRPSEARREMASFERQVGSLSTGLMGGTCKLNRGRAMPVSRPEQPRAGGDLLRLGSPMSPDLGWGWCIQTGQRGKLPENIYEDVAELRETSEGWWRAPGLAMQGAITIARPERQGGARFLALRA